MKVIKINVNNIMIYNDHLIKLHAVTDAVSLHNTEYHVTADSCFYGVCGMKEMYEYMQHKLILGLVTDLNF